MKKRMLKFIKWISAIYLAVCILLFVFQRKLIYFPTPDMGRAPEHLIEIKLDDVTLRGWALNKTAADAVIYFGGNAESIEFNIQEFKSLFPDRAVFLIPYRGYGGSEGSPSEESLYQDALAIFDFAATKHGKVSVIGRSIGSGIASYVATKRPVEKLVMVTPFDSIVAIAQQQYPMLPVKYLLLDRYESIDRVAEIKAPTLMLIAERDRIVPRANSRRLEEAFDSEKLKVVVVEGADHNDISAYNRYSTSISRFL